MRILFLGDIVGSPGRNIIKDKLARFKKDNQIDFAIANGENAAAGSGLTPKITDELLDSGIDALTSGDHIWKKKDIYDYLKVSSRLVRPLNYPEGAPGRGSTVLEIKGRNIAVINLIGRVFMDAVECPFLSVKKELRAIKEKTNIILVDIHAEATSEKVALGWYLDGEVSAVVGTHTHIQTSDNRILDKGTAYITDCGMTGPYDSVIGRDKDLIIEHFVTQLPIRFEMAGDDVRMSGVLLDIDDNTGRATSIKRVHGKEPMII